MSEQTRLLVGLGNPGAKYEATRHNIGFRLIDVIASHFGAPAFKGRFQGAFSEFRIEGRKVLLLKPQTFMNESGCSVGPALKFFGLPIESTIVFHDELDLVPGKVRVKQGGGVAGHNGLRSIKAHAGNESWRVRIGIGHPGRPDAVAGYVLKPFAKVDDAWIAPLLDEMPRLLPLLLDNNVSEFMNQLHLRTAPPGEKAGKKAPGLKSAEPKTTGPKSTGQQAKPAEKPDAPSQPSAPSEIKVEDKESWLSRLFQGGNRS
jgi:PTH1 family peptidyl-tRNA hydrolase